MNYSKKNNFINTYQQTSSKERKEKKILPGLFGKKTSQEKSKTVEMVMLLELLKS